MLLFVSCLLFFCGSIFAQDGENDVCINKKDELADPNFKIDYFDETKTYVRLGIADSSDKAPASSSPLSDTCPTRNITRVGSESILNVSNSDDEELEPYHITLEDASIAKGKESEYNIEYVFLLASGIYFVESVCNKIEGTKIWNNRIEVLVLPGNSYKEALTYVKKYLGEKGIGFNNFSPNCKDAQP